MVVVVVRRRGRRHILFGDRYGPWEDIDYKCHARLWLLKVEYWRPRPKVLSLNGGVQVPLSELNKYSSCPDHG